MYSSLGNFLTTHNSFHIVSFLELFFKAYHVMKHNFVVLLLLETSISFFDERMGCLSACLHSSFMEFHYVEDILCLVGLKYFSAWTVIF